MDADEFTDTSVPLSLSLSFILSFSSLSSSLFLAFSLSLLLIATNHCQFACHGVDLFFTAPKIPVFVFVKDFSQV